MKYDVISADCHVDLIWLPTDLFTANAPGAVKDRVYTDGPRGKECDQERLLLGLMNGMGSAGRKYEPGKTTAPTGWPRRPYADGEKGIRRDDPICG